MSVLLESFDHRKSIRIFSKTYTKQILGDFIRAFLKGEMLAVEIFIV